MGNVARHFRNKRVLNPKNMDDAIRRGEYDFNLFFDAPGCTIADAAVAGGTYLIPVRLQAGHYTYEYVHIGPDTEVTGGFVPTLRTAGGYNLLMTSDVVGNGIELNFGGTRAGHPRNFKPRVTGGGGANWFRRCLLLFDNVSGVDVVMGFAKIATPVNTLTEIVDVVGLRILGDSSSGLAVVSIVYNQNNAGTTDYTEVAVGTLTDAQTIELEVRCVGGYWQFWVNGAQVSPGTSIQADLDDEFRPILRAIETTDGAADMALLATEGGDLAFRSEELLTALAGTIT